MPKKADGNMNLERKVCRKGLVAKPCASGGTAMSAGHGIMILLTQNSSWLTPLAAALRRIIPETHGL